MRLILVLSILLLAPTLCAAQPFRFMDESGNLHWAESIEEIPRQYRNQVLIPTPIPTYKGRRPKPPPPTRKPKPTRPPRKSLRDQKLDKLRGGEHQGTLNVPAMIAPNQTAQGSAPDSLATPPPPADQRKVVENEVAFEGAKAESSLTVVTVP